MKYPQPVPWMDLWYQGPGPWARDQDRGPRTMGQGPGTRTMDHGPGTRAQDLGPGTRDQDQGPSRDQAGPRTKPGQGPTRPGTKPALPSTRKTLIFLRKVLISIRRQRGGTAPGKTTWPQWKTYITRTLRSSLSGKMSAGRSSPSESSRQRPPTRLAVPSLRQ